MRVSREFVSLASPTSARAGHGSYPCQGVYYTSDGTRPKTALIATHYDIDFSEHYLADFMAARGYGFLGWNTRFRGNGAYFILEPALVDIGAGVRWLREEAGIDNVVLLGNSGGASLMSAHQALGDAPGDLFISLCAHPGRPEVHTAWIDPSVTDETDLLSADPALDMFNPDNGPPYSAEFIERYRAAQVARNERITRWAKEEIARLEAAGSYDRTFNIYRVWADLRFLDLAIDPSERTVGCYFGDPKRANYGPWGIGAVSTCRSWLSMWSLQESRCRGGPNLAKVQCPSLVIQSTADQGCYPSDAQLIFDSLGSQDKQLEMVTGDHYLLTPESARDDTADLIADWLRGHLS
ncbi:MAG TPA: alpha/beta hydrolase [Actinomycetota bacterium]|nr:alpha/beta hydrolase [Actinomycetota bacterium]